MAATIEILKKVPIFQSFSHQEIERLACLFKQAFFAKGDTVCREGEAGQCFYIIESGEMEVMIGGENPIVINRMGPGEFFGEIALLEEGQRTATIQCSRDARLLVLNQDDFNRYFLKNAKALLYLSKFLGKRLDNLSRHRIIPKPVTVVAVNGHAKLKGKTITALALGLLLNQFSGKRTLYIEIFQPGDERSHGAHAIDKVLKQQAEGISKSIKAPKDLPPGLSVIFESANDRKIREKLSRLIEIFKDDFAYLVFDIQSDDEMLRTAVREEADYHVEVVENQPEPAECQSKIASSVFLPLINRFNSGSLPLPVNHMSPFILPVQPDLKNAGTTGILRYIQKYPTAPFCLPLHRLARKILGITVGLALGGGAAFGLAHIGVIQALEENGIPIDVIAGTSMGSIVAVLYAAGNSGKQLTEITSRFNIKQQLIATALDISLAKPGGLLTGKRVKTTFRSLMNGAQSFEDLVIPCRTVATDIETGERVAIKDGRLDEAFNASSSVPMVWCPVNHQGRVLVDGAITDPVPAEVVREMGADICIAINVVPPIKKGVDTLLTMFYRKINRLNPLLLLSRTRNAPNMFGVIMNAIQTLQYELGNFKAISADVLINPDLSEFTWVEFYRAAELMGKGRHAAIGVLPEINQAISQRLNNKSQNRQVKGSL